MAKMYPAQVRATTTSQAERALFEVLRNQLSDEWIVLHSLGIAGHNRKPWAEIDFVLIGPLGVYCLEVKGGTVSRHAGRWYFGTEAKLEGPFEQVGSAASALYKHLDARLSWMNQTVVGQGVVTPDITFTITGPDIESEIVYDIRDARRSFKVYLQRLADYWWPRIRRRAPIPLSEIERLAILDELRGDFDLRPSLRAQVGQVTDELLSLTKEQYRRLDELVDNDRVLIRGGAGTGKTLLAAEEARRHDKLGASVFLCCYNRQLAGYLQLALKECRNVTVQSLHSYMTGVVTEAGLQDQLPALEQTDLFEVYYPALCLDGLAALGRTQSYDVLIVDEAQDLLRSEYLEVFNALLKGGLAQGIWRFFFDPFQNLFTGTAPHAMEQLLQNHPAQFRLTINCRNTQPVATSVMMVSGVQGDAALKVEGPEVDRRWYADEGHVRDLVLGDIQHLLKAGIPAGEIVVLSRKRLAHSSLRAGLPWNLGARLIEIGASGATASDTIRFATVGAFKGLEADAVLLIDLDDLESSDARTAIYVGASRARAILVLYLAENQRAVYKQRVFEFGEQLRGRGAPPKV